MRAAVIQYTPIRGDVGANIERIGRLLEGVGAELIVLPELCTTGYFYTDPEELRQLSEPAGEGVLGRLIRETAEANRITVIAGYAELGRDGRLYNAALAALPDGSTRNYRKTHLFYREPEVFSPGDTGFVVFDVDTVRIGLMVCYDWRFPESTRTLRLRGAQVVAHPSNLVATRDIWVPSTGVRAFENRMFILTANRAGREQVGDVDLAFSGGSAIFDVSGRLLASLDMEDGVIVEELDIARTEETSFNGINDIMGDRRPEMYDL